MSNPASIQCDISETKKIVEENVSSCDSIKSRRESTNSQVELTNPSHPLIFTLTLHHFINTSKRCSFCVMTKGGP